MLRVVVVPRLKPGVIEIQSLQDWFANGTYYIYETQ